MPLTVLLRCIGYGTDAEILELFGDNNKVLNATLERDHTDSFESGLLEIYKRLRPGEPANVDNARNLFENLFFESKRYDLAHVGRYKLNKKLSARRRLRHRKLSAPVLDPNTGEIIVDAGVVLTTSCWIKFSLWTCRRRFSAYTMITASRWRGVQRTAAPGTNTITRQDIVAVIGYLLNLCQGIGEIDDIDHLGTAACVALASFCRTSFGLTFPYGAGG